MDTYRNHWEKVYETKTPDQVSWTQEIPKTSLDFFHACHLSKKASIIDVGGGDSKLVDYLLDEGYENITVLDISAKALEKSKQRLGKKAEKIKWIISDILDFIPKHSFDFWHDRAAFHFLTQPEQISNYADKLRQFVSGYLTIGTFSDKGPDKCSGLNVRQYNPETLTALLHDGFEKIRCVTEDHITPFNTVQNFLFCSFKRRES